MPVPYFKSDDESHLDDDQYYYYQEAKAESRACGDFDFPSFEAWSGIANERDAADYRMQMEMDSRDETGY